MARCPYTDSDPDCDIFIALMVSQEAENEALGTFHEMQKELKYYIHRVDVLEALLFEHGISLPEVDD